MTPPPATVRYRAVSMQLAAHMDTHNVEMNIVTDTGVTIAIVCARDSIFSVQKHIEQIGKACPQISTWSDEPRAMLKCVEAPLQFPIRS